MKQLPCLVNHAHLKHSEFSDSQNAAHPRCVPTALLVYEALLASEEFRVLPDSRRAAFGIISQFLSHSFVNGPDLKKLLPVLRTGLIDEDRGVRLEAG